MTNKRLKIAETSIIKKPLPASKPAKIEVMHTMLPLEQAKLLELFCNLFQKEVSMCKARNGTEGAIFSEKTKLLQSQVLVVENQECPPRSPKTLLALVYQVPIVGYQWVHNSQYHGKLEDPKAYQFKKQ